MGISLNRSTYSNNRFWFCQILETHNQAIFCFFLLACAGKMPVQRPPWRHGPPRWIWDFGLLVGKGAAEKGVVVTGAETNHPVFWLVYSHHATHGFATGRHFRSAQIAKGCWSLHNSQSHIVTPLGCLPCAENLIFDTLRPHSWASVHKPPPSGKLSLKTCLDSLDMALRWGLILVCNCWQPWWNRQAEVVGCGCFQCWGMEPDVFFFPALTPALFLTWGSATRVHFHEKNTRHLDTTVLTLRQFVKGHDRSLCPVGCFLGHPWGDSSHGRSRSLDAEDCIMHSISC